MKPIDLRNATWRDVLTHITEDMVRVHLAVHAYGPGTTRQIATSAGISLLTLRPRTTDLLKLGLVELVGKEGNEGIYAARSREEAYLSAAWQERADFRGQVAEDKDQPVGFITVEQAVDSLQPAEQAALGAKLLGRYGHLLKKRNPTGDTGQLDLLTA